MLDSHVASFAAARAGGRPEYPPAGVIAYLRRASCSVRDPRMVRILSRSAAP